MFKNKRENKRRELESIQQEFDQRTENISNDIWDLRDFLMLLNLADNAYLGASKAIIYAFKLGYVAGRKGRCCE